jgi:hypothetical protein
VAAFLVLTSCGPSNHRYLADRDEKVYLRVPSGWHDVTPLDDRQDRLVQATTDARIVFKRVATPQDGATSEADFSGSAPFVTMTVYETKDELNQQLSPTLARRLSWAPFDPLMPSADQSELAQIIDFDPNPANSKLDGSRVVYRWRQDTTTDWLLTVSLSTFFDASEQRLYALEVACNPSCFDNDAEEINSIVNSWRIDR